MKGLVVAEEEEDDAGLEPTLLQLAVAAEIGQGLDGWATCTLGIGPWTDDPIRVRV